MGNVGAHTNIALSKLAKVVATPTEDFLLYQSSLLILGQLEANFLQVIHALNTELVYPEVFVEVHDLFSCNFLIDCDI